MKISDVAARTGLSAKTIRYYEDCKLITVQRGENRYREYDTANVDKLIRIKWMRQLGIAIADIKLWCDGVIPLRELVVKRRQELDLLDQLSMSSKKLCDDILSGDVSATYGADLFTEQMSGEEVHPGIALALGIDIGTTSIAAQILRLDNGETVHTYTFDHDASIEIPGYPDAYAADAKSLTQRTLGLTASAIDSYPGIVAIGITGQMHGIVCLDKEGEILSPLYTWQNCFCTRSFTEGMTLSQEISALCGEKVPTGYGLGTYLALKRLGLLPEGTDRVCVIADYIAMRLCGSNRLLSHPQNAASMGFFANGDFLRDKTALCGIPETVLPEVCGDYQLAGSYRGIPVAVALGDNQAAVFGSLMGEEQILLNIGTSGQVSRVLTAADTDDLSVPAGELRPYMGNSWVHSGSILCGGRAYATLADLIGEIVSGLGKSVSRSDIYRYLNQAAEQGEGTQLKVSTCFLGTREDASVRGSVTGMDLDNFNFSGLAYGMLEGIIREMHTLYTRMTEDASGKAVVVSGNAVRRNPTLRKVIGKFFGTPILIPKHTEEAAYGAALYASVASGALNREDAAQLIQYIKEDESIQ